MFYFLVFLFVLFNKNYIVSQEFDDYKNYSKRENDFKLVEIFKGLNNPFGLSILNDKNLLITEKGGRLLKVNVETGESKNIEHPIPSIKFNSKGFFSQQGGLLDVYFNSEDEFIYFSYSHDFKERKNLRKSGYSTALARGKLVDNKIEDFQILLVARPETQKNIHWGSRIVIKEDYLYAGFGERGEGNIAQNPKTHPGSIIRINKDGTLPHDNPAFKNNPEWLPEIYSIGVRNPQGIAISPYNGEVLFSQHGPRGGDNIAKVLSGGNYGWNEVAWGGTEYSGRKIGDTPFKKKFVKPIKVWVPSIAVGNIGFYNGKAFKEWNGDLLVTATKTEMLLRLDYFDGNIVGEEIILQGEIGRIRDFEIDDKGEIYIIVDEENSSLWKLSK